MSANPLETFTVPARLLIVASLVLLVGGTAFLIMSGFFSFTIPLPLWFVFIPALLPSAALLTIGLGVLRLLGVPIRKKSAAEEGHSEYD